jgi:protein translocase SecG subunit
MTLPVILLNILFLIICVLLIIVVLLQRGRGGGLGAAFGGAGSSAFGTRTGDVFTWVTIVLTALFLLLAIGVAVGYRPDIGQVAAPTFNPPAQPIEEATRVGIASSTPGATIYYTVDGSTPTEKSRAYQGTAVYVKQGQTLKAIAVRAGMETSPLAEASYPRPQAAGPSFDPPAGELTEATSVALTTDTDDAVIYYTTDGSDPTLESDRYEGPIDVEPGMTIRARAYPEDDDIDPSPIVEAAYTKPAATSDEAKDDEGEPAGTAEEPEETDEGDVPAEGPTEGE